MQTMRCKPAHNILRFLLRSRGRVLFLGVFRCDHLAKCHSDSGVEEGIGNYLGSGRSTHSSASNNTLPWHLIPCLPIQLSPIAFLEYATLLLEEERSSRNFTLMTDVEDPLLRHGTCSRPGFGIHNYPVNTLECMLYYGSRYA